MPEIPTGWSWTRLGQAAFSFQNGTSKRRGTGDPIVVVRLADIRNGELSAERTRQIGLSDKDREKYTIVQGDILAIRVNGSAALVGRLIPVRETKGWTYCDHLIRVRAPCELRHCYLSAFASTPTARDHLEEATVTTAGQKTINQTGLGALPVPIPPVAEQDRIVARVDELMGLIDRLEAARNARETTRAASRDAVLAALREADTPEEVEDAWNRFAERMDDLVCDPADIDPLRQTVLQLAVRGKLVPQDPTDEPASVLLERIAAEKARLVREKKIRKPKPLPPVDQSKAPYEIPNGWQWGRFGDSHINRDSERIPLKVQDRANRQGPYDYYGASGVIDHIDDYLFDGDLLLIGEDGANLVLRSKPIAFMASGKFWVNNHAHVLDSVDVGSLRYLSIFVNAIDLKPYLSRRPNAKG